MLEDNENQSCYKSGPECASGFHKSGRNVFVHDREQEYRKHEHDKVSKNGDKERNILDMDAEADEAGHIRVQRDTRSEKDHKERCQQERSEIERKAQVNLAWNLADAPNVVENTLNLEHQPDDSPEEQQGTDQADSARLCSGDDISSLVHYDIQELRIGRNVHEKDIAELAFKPQTT